MRLTARVLFRNGAMIKENFLVCQEEAMTKRSMVINMYLKKNGESEVIP